MSGSGDIFSLVCQYHRLGCCVIPSGGGLDGKAACLRVKARNRKVRHPPPSQSR